jgi:hypothetical protein
MKFDQKKAAAWLKDTSAALPEIDQIIKNATSDILVIGAGVFDIYSGQGWTPILRRKTGDLDLSVGLVSGEEDYAVLKAAFLAAGYKNKTPAYRFFPPKLIPGALSYLDLLAHPKSGKINDCMARNVMGAGAGFSLKGMGFASTDTFQIAPHIHCPNPIAMVLLKMISYQDEPTTRIKDLADIAELGWGLVEKGMHFQMKDLWTAVGEKEEAKKARKVLLDLAGGESVVWDLESARQELLQRNFTDDDIESAIPEKLKEWASYLE